MPCDYKIVVSDGTSNSATYLIKPNYQLPTSATSKQHDSDESSPTEHRKLTAGKNKTTLQSS